MEIVEEKLKKLINIAEKCKRELESGNKRTVIGDMREIQDKAEGVIYLLLAQIEEDK